ncbi:MAG: glycosyltransferase [Oscillospiraceae bacterium]|nr:glycosyltransferase [Oscillospiraceae bacterium]
MSAAVSIIVPVYQAEAYLDDCVRSVLAQRFTDWELILADDGSTDGSPALCDEWAASFPGQIKVIHQANAGVSAARNAGISLATGEYLAFLDADDLYDPDYLKAMVGAMRENNADLCLCGYRRFGKTGDGERTEYPFLPVTPFDETFIHQVFAPWLMRHQSCNAVWNKVFRRDMVLAGEIAFPAGQAHGEDRAFFLRCLARCGRAVYVPQALYCYRQIESSAVHSLRFDPTARLMTGFRKDIPLFEALGAAPEEAVAGCREGLATAFYHELWRLAESADRRRALPLLRGLLRGGAAEEFWRVAAARRAALFPGRPARIIRALAKLHSPGLIRFFIRAFLMGKQAQKSRD